MAEHRAKHADVYVNYVAREGASVAGEARSRRSLDAPAALVARDLFPASMHRRRRRGGSTACCAVTRSAVGRNRHRGCGPRRLRGRVPRGRRRRCGAHRIFSWAQGVRSRGTGLLRDVSTRKPHRALADHPELLALVDRARRRVVEVESQRGDRPSAASMLALQLRWTGGLETLALALPALGKAHFARAFGWAIRPVAPGDAEPSRPSQHPARRRHPRGLREVGARVATRRGPARWSSPCTRRSGRPT